jgi:DNA repair protein RadC
MTNQLDMFQAGDNTAKAPALDEATFLARVANCAYPVAEELVSQYGGLSDVVRAAQWNDPAFPADLRPQVLALHSAVAALSRTMLLGRQMLDNFDLVVNFCRVQMAHIPHKEVYALFLDRKNQLLAAEIIGQGTVSKAPIYPREIARRCLELHSTAVILAHNHPSGDPAPSSADIHATGQVKAALKPLEIELHDHIIVSATGHYSFRTAGLL